MGSVYRRGLSIGGVGLSEGSGGGLEGVNGRGRPIGSEARRASPPRSGHGLLDTDAAQVNITANEHPLLDTEDVLDDRARTGAGRIRSIACSTYEAR